MSGNKALRFACPACGARVTVNSDQAGERLRCPGCDCKLRVPGRKDAGGGSGRDRESEFPVICGVCQTRMYATSSQIGSKIRCPDCYSYTEVVRPSTSQRSPYMGSLGSGIGAGGVSDADGPDDDYRLQDSELPWRSMADATVPIVCEVCRTRMYAREDQLGEYVTCPDCGRLTRITEHDIARWRASHPAGREEDAERLLAEAAAAPRVNVHREQAEQLMRKAEEDIEANERKLPVIPARPMIQGIYSYLFQPPTLVLWSCIAGAVALVGFIVFVMFGGGDPRMILPGLLLMVTAVPLIFGFMATQLIAIVFNTSEGYDELVNAPDNSFVAWVADLWMVACAAAYASFPGYVMFHLGMDARLVYGAGATAAFVLFPIMLLSMLELGSRFIPFSGLIWSSVLRHPIAWMSFYLQTAVMVAASGGAALAFYRSSSFLGRLGWGLLASVLISAMVLIYFRLLGRLVLTCGTLEGDVRGQPVSSGRSAGESRDGEMQDGAESLSAAGRAESDLLLP